MFLESDILVASTGQILRESVQFPTLPLATRLRTLNIFHSYNGKDNTVIAQAIVPMSPSK